MQNTQTIYILSDIHYAGDAEKRRGCTEFTVIGNPLLRLLVRVYRHFIWLRNPMAHNHLLDEFIEAARDADYVIANGDYSCDTGFIGISDDAAFDSASQCIGKLRQRFGPKLRACLGDHELGKISLVGGRGGMRFSSWERAQTGLGLEPFWTLSLGNYLLMGVTSSLLALPVFEPEILADEKKQWQLSRNEHLELIREAVSNLRPNQRLLLFCHDPTALPFLWRDETIQPKLRHLETTVIGHLHSPLLLWKSRLLSGMPAIRILGNSIRRMSTALKDARLWRHFYVKLCPSLAGIQLLKDGGYYRVLLDPTGRQPLRFELERLSNLGNGK